MSDQTIEQRLIQVQREAIRFKQRLAEVERRLNEIDRPEFPQKRLRSAIDEARDAGIPVEEAQRIMLDSYEAASDGVGPPWRPSNIASEFDG